MTSDTHIFYIAHIACPGAHCVAFLLPTPLHYLLPTILRGQPLTFETFASSLDAVRHAAAVSSLAVFLPRQVGSGGLSRLSLSGSAVEWPILI